METLTITEIFNMFQSQYSQVDKLWNYFGVVSLAVAGFTIGNDKASSSLKEPFFIIVGYLAFCLGNYHALLEGHTFLYALAEKYNSMTVNGELPHLQLSTPAEISRFYCIVVATFSTAVAVVSFSRLKQARAQTSQEQTPSE
ncbi:hypothetical protein L2725_06890 [Shewanella corallii]|uniref:Transmembrane protein n=1 Tax=Shewanella corallii TaxID=560080 RepID=A0ABT0N512_9GAMM|nr:hypothetical protein [Shewanella corallii]MCL2913514.1 hypothetical protein [Shewanella corallii]